MIKKYNEFIREFVETGSDSVLDAKMQEIKELVDSIGGQAFMYEWENKNDHELFVNFTSNELVLRYEFDIDDLMIKKIASNVVDFETKVNSIDEGLDIIEKDIHSILGVSESFDNEDELDEDLILSLMKDKGWGDLSYNRIDDFKDSDYYKNPFDENEFAEQFDETPVEQFTNLTEFKNLAEWSSLTALSIIAMVDEELEKRITGADIRSSKTIEDLFIVIQSK